MPKSSVDFVTNMIAIQKEISDMTSDIAALRKWSKLDKATQNRLLANAFCVDCFVTTIVDYEITLDKFGIVLRGKCKQCGKDVARVVEDD